MATSTVMALMETVKQLLLELSASLQHEDSSAEGSSCLQQALSQWRSKLLSNIIVTKIMSLKVVPYTSALISNP